ncbi:hypothetical protein [Klebsiella oxytoca]|uniref:hypothetical protein n=1 Tax=Klebsiella oxytoca TaxID=571 RepID=UPI00157B8406|nr:hypothetical protein [Klebsiella oxytoca]
MSRLSVTINSPSIRQTIKSTAKRSNCTESSVVLSCVTTLAPILEKMNENHQSALNLQGRLQKFIVTETVSQIRANPCIVPEEVCKIIYQKSIKGNSLITPADSHQQKSGNDSMSKREAVTIKEQLRSLKESINAKKIIYIYNERKIELKTLRVYGRANIIPIKEDRCDNYFFDFDHIQILSTSDLITFGTAELIKKKNIAPPHPYICWIDIYHVNGLSIMLPVANATDVSTGRKASSDVIIINPFSSDIQSR